MKIKALSDWVLIKPIDEKEEVVNGIIVPKIRSPKGQVVSVGQNVKVVHKGDVVLFKKWDGTEYKIDKEIHYFFNMSKVTDLPILGIFSD